MCDEWMTSLRLALTEDEFRMLPRNAAYQYDYVGQALLTPRPRFYHAVLPLPAPPGEDPLEPVSDLTVRAARAEDLPGMVEAFAAAFRGVPPFAALVEGTLTEAAQQCLRRTLDGGDGPWVQEASFLAHSREGMAGAVLVTLVPDGDPCEQSSYHWERPPPTDLLERRQGRPHLTWIFVAPARAGHGAGTALLAAAAAGLAALGYRQLFSTFLLGNDSSLLWHWRTGFRLLTHPASRRRLGRRLRERLD
jgi:ribosomal protein S18 acetylase RimI-like enzyme